MTVSFYIQRGLSFLSIAVPYRILQIVFELVLEVSCFCSVEVSFDALINDIQRKFQLGLMY